MHCTSVIHGLINDIGPRYAPSDPEKKRMPSHHFANKPNYGSNITQLSIQQNGSWTTVVEELNARESRLTDSNIRNEDSTGLASEADGRGTRNGGDGKE